MGKSIKLGKYCFSTKKEAKEFYSKILNSTKLEHHLKGENYDYVMALLLNHPRANEKIGCGVNTIKVSSGYSASNRCFHIVRADKTIENFSIGKCIDGEHSEFNMFCAACRKVVETDIRAYKRKYFDENSDKRGKVKCQSSNQSISFSEAHVDHREPFTFSAIVYFFYKALRIDLSSIQYETENNYGSEFIDENLIKSFIKWHNEHAKLRILHSKVNLSKAHFGRVQVTKMDGVLTSV